MRSQHLLEIQTTTMDQRLGGFGTGANGLGNSRIAEALHVTKFDRRTLSWDESFDATAHQRGDFCRLDLMTWNRIPAG